MSVKLQLKRNETPFTSKDEAMQKLQEQLSTAQAGEIIIATYDATPHSIEYKMIDLGLPSGLLWADKNIGASTEKEAGLYFQWGDTQGYTAEQVGNGEGQKAFSQDDYKFYVDGEYIKYNGIDGKTVLDPEDDAASVNMGGDWRMPTVEDFNELFLNTDIYVISSEGNEVKATVDKDIYGNIQGKWEKEQISIKGVKFYKKDEHSIYMFCPLTGVVSDGLANAIDIMGLLWTSFWDSYEPIMESSQLAYHFHFDNEGVRMVFDGTRFEGYPIRGVMPQS